MIWSHWRDLTQLPTVKEVLQRFHHHLSEQTVTQAAVRNASHITITDVLSVWSKAAVPTTLKKHAIDKLEKYHADWLLLKKNRGRLSASQRQRESQYEQDIEHVFDIAHALVHVRISPWLTTNCAINEQPFQKATCETSQPVQVPSQAPICAILSLRKLYHLFNKMSMTLVSIVLANGVLLCMYSAYNSRAA